MIRSLSKTSFIRFVAIFAFTFNLNKGTVQVELTRISLNSNSNRRSFDLGNTKSNFNNKENDKSDRGNERARVCEKKLLEEQVIFLFFSTNFIYFQRTHTFASICAYLLNWIVCIFSYRIDIYKRHTSNKQEKINRRVKN